MRTSRIAESLCLCCRKPLDGVTDPMGQAMPSPGDVTICLYCGHLMAFGDGLTLRELSDEEIVDIAGDKTVLAMQRARSQT
jgi:hypothetical protein